MGGRGASSGISDKGKIYGTEYRTILKSGNIKFVKSNESGSTKTPMETMTKGRVYVTVNNKDELQAITYYDEKGKKSKQIDLTHKHDGNKPHTHLGYEHNSARNITKEERKIIDKIVKLWYNRK